VTTASCIISFSFVDANEDMFFKRWHCWAGFAGKVWG